jgi:Ser/Thr protein kinase RdoA (MazF antagonist)
VDAQGATLHAFAEHRFALFPRKGGHAPDLERGDDLEVLGRTLARIHQVGGRARFVHRPTLSVERLGIESRTLVLDGGFVPAELRDAYASTTAHLLDRLTRLRIEPRQRIHGDCHPGNILWRDDAPHFVDFDDCTMGPAVQDLWMLLSGDRASMAAQLHHVLAGYEQFRDFDRRELALVEALRTLRLIHYSAWIAGRWDDPAFPAAFPWFGTQRYWQDRILELREQVALMDEPPLRPA